MAIAFVQSNNSATASVAYNSNVTVNNFLIVMVSQNGVTTLGVSDTQGNTWNPIAASQLNYSSNRSMQAWWAVAKSTGADTVTFTGGTTFWCVCTEYSGVATSSPQDSTTNTNTGTSTTPTSGTVTTANGNDLLWCAGGCSTAQTWTAGLIGGSTGNLRGVSGATTSKANVEDKIVSATGSYTAAFTIGASVAWGVIFAAFKAAAAAFQPDEDFWKNPYPAQIEPNISVW